MQLSKDSRATTSCSECQRRKQRCSREWPCNHCQARKVAHLCQFTVRKLQQESPPDSAREPSNEARGRKRSLPGSPNATAALSDPDAGDSEDGLKFWGYMPGHVHYKVGPAEDKNSPRKDSPAETVISDAVERILHAIPPRSITDAFVNHFLGVVNYRYSAIYGPTLTDQYVQWWADRAAGKRLSPEFTCLLLRICAYSVQYLTPALRKMIEFELACDSQVLTDRFAAAAEQLSQSFEASNTTIERVQEQFLKGAWLKSESKIVESWHALGCTIREAQELGIDKDAGIEGLSEFDIEIRRRIWTLLYIWDCPRRDPTTRSRYHSRLAIVQALDTGPDLPTQMSAWLGRPNLIDQKNLTFKFPNLRLDSSSTEPNLLSPFAHMALQANLGRRVATVLGDAQSTDGLSAKQVLSVEKEIDKFVEELPPIFKVKNPDRSLDEQHPYFVFQRHQLHCVIFVTMLDFLKPFLTRDRHDKLTENDDEFRKMGIDISLQLLRVARDLFDHEFPINAKFHMVVFSIFDTATLLCSAIIHDRDHVLPQRTEVMDALESSLEMLHQLSLTTKLGAASYKFLHNLVQATPELARYSTKHKRQRKDTAGFSNPSSTSEGVPLPQKAQVDQALGFNAATVDLLPSLTSSADIAFDVENFLANNPFGEFGNPSNLDMGGMEHIWDWENLHLDGFSQTDPTG